MTRVIITGNSTFKDYDLLKKECDRILKGAEVEIVSGRYTGTERWAIVYANDRCLKVRAFYPNYTENGSAAERILMLEMACNSDILIAFWDGMDKSTDAFIKIAKKQGLEIHIIKL